MSAETPIVPPIDSTTTTPVSPAPGPERPALVIDGAVRIPAGIVDSESFRRRTASAEFPAGVHVAWREGALWIETPAGPCLSRVRPDLRLPPVPQTEAAVVIDGELWIPTSVVDRESFHQWVLSQEYPKCVR